jgi:hypothetical protein
MKQQFLKLGLYLGGVLIVALILGVILQSCTPVRYVNVESRHNYYEHHRYNTYTSPMWVPGYGVILQTHIIPKRFIQRQPQQRVEIKRTPRGKF